MTALRPGRRPPHPAPPASGRLRAGWVSWPWLLSPSFASRPAPLDRHGAFLVRPAGLGGLGIVPGNDPYALIQAGSDLVGRGALQEGELVPLAGGEDLGPRLLHFLGVGPALQAGVAQRQAQIARPQLGKAQSRHRQDFIAMSDAGGALDLYNEQKLALGIE